VAIIVRGADRSGSRSGRGGDHENGETRAEQVKIVPSILSADVAALSEAGARVEAGGAGPRAQVSRIQGSMGVRERHSAPVSVMTTGRSNRMPPTPGRLHVRAMISRKLGCITKSGSLT
jgi:hypothetical protein